MTPESKAFFSGAATVLVTGLLTGLFNLLISHKKDKSETRRQTRELAVKLALEQWKLDAEKWNEFNTRIKKDPALTLGMGNPIPEPRIINIVTSIIEVLERK